MKGSDNSYFLCTRGLYVACLTLLYALFTIHASAQTSSSGEIRKVVIDAGHGGKDPGTMYKTVREKDITLAVALKLGKLIQKQYPSVQVIYTRSKDVFVELDERSRIANRNNADLFISIHVNSVANKNSSASGSETYVMGLHKTAENMAVAQRENAVITYESDFSSKYEGYDPNSPESFIIFSLMQNAHLDQSLQLASLVQHEFGSSPIRVNRGVRQAGFLVLWKTATPSILVELGFISNEADRKALTSDEHQDKLAEHLLNAFGSYKTKYERTAAATGTADRALPVQQDVVAVYSDAKPDDTVSTIVQGASVDEPVYYRVQIMSIAKKESTTAKIFKGYKGVQAVKAGKLYKYTVGNTTKQEEALALCKKAGKDFPGAFVVAYKDGVLTSVR